MAESHRRDRCFLYGYVLLFVLSGFSGLIYESIWSHYLKLFLGHAAYAQTLVLAIYMGGMALGAWMASRYTLRINNLIWAYALVEGAVGLFAFGFHRVFLLSTGYSYETILPALASPVAIQLFKWSLSAVLILPQSILLGSTFPLLSGGILRRFRANKGRSIALLYFANSLGASIGVLVAGFVLIGRFGLPGTIVAAGTINLVILLAIALLSRFDGGGVGATDAGRETVSGPAPGSLRVQTFFVACALVTGVASFIYEVAWLRMLSMVLGSSTHSFELMLSAFILGLALGGLWIRSRIDGLDSPVYFLALVQLLMGVCAMATLPVYDMTFDLVAFMLDAFGKSDGGYVLFNIGGHALALLVMLPATICAGMTLPLVTFSLLERGYGERSIGRVYALNTVGAIIGLVLAVQVLMPAVGLDGLLFSGAVLDVALGLVILHFLRKEIGGAWRLVPAAVAIAAVLGIAIFSELDVKKMASGIYRYGKTETTDVIRFHEDGKTATVHVVQSQNGNLGSILTNGKPDATMRLTRTVKPVQDEYTMTLLAAIPLDHLPQAKQAATIGMGSGMTSNALLAYASLEAVDTIEIEPAMIEGAKFFKPRLSHVFSDPRSRLIVEDAKTFFSINHKRYDIIVSEPSNPWVSGTASLFSDEFYRMIRGQLSEQGLFVQWLHLYEIDMPLVASVMQAVSANFSDYVVYETFGTDILIVAAPTRKVPELTGRVFRSPGVSAELSELAIRSVDDIRARYLGSKEALDLFLSNYPIRMNSDFYPVLDQRAVKQRYLESEATDFMQPVLSSLPILEMTGTNRRRFEYRGPPNPLDRGTRVDAVNEALAIAQYSSAPRGSAERERVALSPESARHLEQIAQFTSGASCSPRGIELLWLPSFRHVMDASISILAPDERSRVVATLTASLASCATETSNEVRLWVRLYRAIAEREGEGMFNAARRLLPDQGDIKDTPDHRFLMKNILLASIVEGDAREARQLMKRFKLIEELDAELLMLDAMIARLP